MTSSHLITRSIPCLVKNLNSTTDPFTVLNHYQGNDWQKMVCYYPVSIWKNDYMELLIRKWKKNELQKYVNNYSTVHTHVLDGKFKSIVLLGPEKLPLLQYIAKYEHTTFHPFSKVNFFSLENSATIQLQYYHHYY